MRILGVMEKIAKYSLSSPTFPKKIYDVNETSTYIDHIDRNSMASHAQRRSQDVKKHSIRKIDMYRKLLQTSALMIGLISVTYMIEPAKSQCGGELCGKDGECPAGCVCVTGNLCMPDPERQ